MENNEEVCSDKIITMPISEFYMLAGYFGINKVFGYSFDEKKYSKQDMIGIIHNMVKRGVLEVKNNSFECSDTYKAMKDYLKYASQVIQIKISGIDNPVCIGYLGEKIMITEISDNNSKRLNIRWIEKNSISDYIRDHGYLSGILNIYLNDRMSEQKRSFDDGMVLFQAEIIEADTKNVLKSLRAEYKFERIGLIYTDENIFDDIYDGIDMFDELMERLTDY